MKKNSELTAVTEKKTKIESARADACEAVPAVPVDPPTPGVVTTRVRWPKKTYFRSSRSAYEQLLQSIYDGVLITNLDGLIVDFNARAAQLLECDGTCLANRSVLSVIAGTDEKLLAAIAKNLEDQRYTLIEARCVRSDGQSFPAEIAVNRIELDARGLLCFFIRDITVRQRAQEALEAAVARLEEHDTSRLQFISNVSHELRTPLTSMIYAVNNMLSGIVGAVPPRVRQYLQILDGDCRRLLATVNDILDMRKIETKTLTLTRKKTPIARLVERSAQSLRLQAQQKSIDLNFLPGRKNWFLDCDAQKMERVLLNVIGNSIKFTPQGGCIEIGLDEDAGHPGHARISVRDTGIGIPPEALDKVTMRYFTVGHQPSGSGLGLAISKEIVALHGGVLDITSPPPGHDKGTLVTMRLPLTTPPRVLIVDDEECILNLLERQIAAEGYQVLRAPGGKEAMDLVARFRPDVVVLDLHLQDMDGSEMILKLRSDRAYEGISVVVVTGGAISQAKAEILASFGVPTLAKPWDDAELLQLIAGTFFSGIQTAKPVGTMHDHAAA
jgi:PAS domain S-box-containing protein